MAKKLPGTAGRGPEEFVSTRERILRMALEVFAEKGLHGATMTEIAKRSGLTAGALYRYFESKQDVFRAVVESHSAPFAFLDMVRTLIPELEPRSAIRFIIQGMFAFFATEFDFMRVVVGEAVKDPESSQPFIDTMLAPARALVGECMDLWRERGLLRDDVDTTIATVSFLGITGYFLIERSFFANQELADLEPGSTADQIADIFLRGVLRKET